MEPKRGVNRGAGVALLISSIAGFVIYAYFLLATQWGIIILKLTILVIVAALIGVLAWIGYTIATAPRNEDSEEKEKKKKKKNNAAT